MAGWSYMRAAKARREIGVTAEDFRKLVDAGVLKAYYRKDKETGLPVGRAFYRSDEVEAAKVEGFSPGNTGATGHVSSNQQTNTQ